MIISDIKCKYKKLKLSSQAPERIVSFKLIVTLDNGIEVELYQDIDQIEKDAIEAAKHKTQNLSCK